MKRLYSSPLRVYLVIIALAMAGTYCGVKLPISLFPNSSKPEIYVGIPYGPLTNEEFLYTYGKNIESRLSGIDTGEVKVESIEANYETSHASFEIEFEWGSPPKTAFNEVVNVINSLSAQLPKESRENRWLWYNRDNAGFFAASFFSSKRSLDELYEIVDPAFRTKISAIPDAENTRIHNPTHKEIRITPNPVLMASFQLFPKDIEAALKSFLSSYRGGSVTVGVQKFQIQIPRHAYTIDDLGKVAVPSPSGKTLHLSELAEIDYAPSSNYSRSFKTNGAPSLILFASPVSGGNVKRMSEDVIRVIEDTMPSLPEDVQYRILVDPSEFIRSAVRNVLNEVFLAAFIAVLVLYLFIGSARNVLTAAIEIPLSMVLAFILMRVFDMNLNLISLGGLALSAGMNVDASVVVMENIFRHMQLHKGALSYTQRLEIICTAVKEVWLPVVAATIASLVVFIPLAFTSELTNAILGDLAKAVVFSHGFSAVVALILVPTIRLQLMKSEKEPKPSLSKVQNTIANIEGFYASALSKFLESSYIKRAFFIGLPVLLALLTAFVLPRLPREIVGKPDTDWLILGINTRGNTRNSQMESQTMKIERDLLRTFGDKYISYTFTQIRNANRATIMSRLKDKRKMKEFWEKVSAKYKNSPLTNYWTEAWNPGELKIPDPPDMRLVIHGGSTDERIEVARDIYQRLQESKAYDRFRKEPNFSRDRGITLSPFSEQWALLREMAKFTPADISDLVRVATDGRRIGKLPVKGEELDIVLRYPQDAFNTAEQIGALPIGVEEKIVPLKALAAVEIADLAPAIYRKNQEEIISIDGRVAKGKEHLAKPSLKTTRKIIQEWRSERKDRKAPYVVIEDADQELSEALKQLLFAVSLSIGLIFVTILLQFGSIATSFLILAAVPFGFIGVIGALWLFGSNVSLNSALGVILLNGIAVANSILLVDFIKRLVDQGMDPKDAAVEAGRKRLRPILITSLTSILGMLPIALGLGDGGRILQPLGITVSAGLWVSTTLTLFLVPALQVSYLEKKESWLKGLKSLLPLKSSTVHATVFFLLSLFCTKAYANIQSFDEAVNEIVTRDPQVESKRAEYRATHARNVPNHLGYLPTLSLDGNYKTGEPFLNSARSSSWGLEGSLSLNIFEFGATQAALNFASDAEDSKEWELKDSVLLSEKQAVVALSSLIAADQRVKIRQRGVDIRTQALTIAKERYKRGLLAQQEVDKVSIEYENALASLNDVQVARLSAEAAVAVLLGHHNVGKEWPWKSRFYELSKTDTFKNTDLSLRPDWKAAKHALEAAHHRKNQTLGNMLPSFDLNASYGYLNNLSQNVDGNIWSAGLYVSIPLFDKLTRVSAYRENIYLASIADANLEIVRRKAKQEWETASATFPISLRTALVREKTAAKAKSLYQSNLKRFEKGRTSVNDLILDQDRLLQSELLLVTGWNTAHIKYTELCHAQGKRIKECVLQ